MIGALRYVRPSCTHFATIVVTPNMDLESGYYGKYRPEKHAIYSLYTLLQFAMATSYHWVSGCWKWISFPCFSMYIWDQKHGTDHSGRLWIGTWHRKRPKVLQASDRLCSAMKVMKSIKLCTADDDFSTSGYESRERCFKLKQGLHKEYNSCWAQLLPGSWLHPDSCPGIIHLLTDHWSDCCEHSIESVAIHVGVCFSKKSHWDS